MKARCPDFVLVDATNAQWPGALPWRGPSSRKGYATREEAEARALRVTAGWNAKHSGGGGPDLRVQSRGEDDGEHGG